MGQVVQLSEFRKPRKTGRSGAPAPETEPAYYCMRCDGGHFNLYPSGLVKCENCGARIRNILVADSTGDPEQGGEQ